MLDTADFFNLYGMYQREIGWHLAKHDAKRCDASIDLCTRHENAVWYRTSVRDANEMALKFSQAKNREAIAR